MPIYRNTQEAILNHGLYSEVFENKGVKHLRIRRTKDLSTVRDLEVELAAEHTWSLGDSLYKLSLRYYNTIENWWIIGLVNSKPTDAHYKIGDVIYIPSEVDRIKGEL